MDNTIHEFITTGETGIEGGESLLHGLKQLVDSDGWKLYRSIVEKQQTARFDSIVLQPIPTIDAALEQEYRKGEIQGMRLALTLPAALIENLTEAVKSAREQREREAAGDQQ